MKDKTVYILMNIFTDNMLWSYLDLERAEKMKKKMGKQNYIILVSEVKEIIYD